MNTTIRQAAVFVLMRDFDRSFEEADRIALYWHKKQNQRLSLAQAVELWDRHE